MGTEDFVDTPLHEAVRYGDLQDVRSALKQGHDPDQIGIYQWSPLHEAANNGDNEILSLLLKYDGDPNRKDKLRGCTAVHYAASQGHEEGLQLLLQAGGRYDAVNSDGESCLDVAVGDCRQLLQDHRDQEGRQIQRKLSLSLSEASLPQHSIPDSGLNSSHGNSSLSGYRGNVPAREDSAKRGRRRSGMRDSESEKDSMFDPDEISVASTGSSSSYNPHGKSWGTGTVTGTKNQLALGHVQLSFEYNSKKSTFNIRVWKLTDLLLPPANTSMIHGIYVKSYLHPDKRKETKRKTEELRVEKQDGEQGLTSPESRYAVFKASSFQFSRPLEYKDITKKSVEEKIIVLEVCITQKYSRKSFMVASLNMPLRMAAKKFVKEKYTLTPCISTQIPENMKVYNACEMSVVHSNRYHSNLSLFMHRDSKAKVGMPKRRTSSEANLSMVVAEMPKSKAPSIEISVPPEEEDEELNEALKQIAIMEDNEASGSRSGSRSISRSGSRVSSGSTQVDMSWSEVGSLSDVSDLDGVSVSKSLAVNEVEVHMPKTKDTQDVKAKKKNSSKRKVRKLGVDEAELGSPSRPDTPSWDYYDEPMTVTTMLPIDFESDLTFDPTAPQLPMATGLDMPEVHRSVKRLPSMRFEDDLTGEESPKSKVRGIQPEPVHSGYAVARSTSEPAELKDSGKGKSTRGAKVKRSTSEGTKVIKRSSNDPAKVKVERAFDKGQRTCSVKADTAVNIGRCVLEDLEFAV